MRLLADLQWKRQDSVKILLMSLYSCLALQIGLSPLAQYGEYAAASLRVLKILWG